jgi:hypothetical protein
MVRRLKVKKKASIFLLMAIMLLMVTACGTTTGKSPNTSDNTVAPTGQVSIAGVSTQLYAPGPNPTVNTSDTHGRVSGVALGIWHGVISPVTLVISFFNKDVQMYEVHNDGNQYNLGFLIGVAIVFMVLGLLLGSGRR